MSTKRKWRSSGSRVVRRIFAKVCCISWAVFELEKRSGRDVGSVSDESECL